MTEIITDYKLLHEKDRRVLKDSFVINDYLRVDADKSQVWRRIKTLETIFNNMGSKLIL